MSLYRIGDILEGVISNIKREELSIRRRVLRRIIRDTDDYVPYNTGELSESVLANPNADGFAYTAPYASYAFYPDSPSGSPKTYDKSTHPLAQGRPFQAAASHHLPEWVELFKQEVLKVVRKG